MAQKKFKDQPRIPYKQFADTRRSSITKAFAEHFAAGQENVSAEQLQSVTQSLLRLQSDDDRNNWLELERWADRLRDYWETDTGGGTVPPVWGTFGINFSGVPCTWVHGNTPYEMSDYGAWTFMSGDSTKFGISSSGRPRINGPGTYAVWLYVLASSIGVGGTFTRAYVNLWDVNGSNLEIQSNQVVVTYGGTANPFTQGTLHSTAPITRTDGTELNLRMGIAGTGSYSGTSTLTIWRLGFP